MLVCLLCVCVLSLTINANTRLGRSLLLRSKQATCRPVGCALLIVSCQILTKDNLYIYIFIFIHHNGRNANKQEKKIIT